MMLNLWLFYAGLVIFSFWPACCLCWAYSRSYGFGGLRTLLQPWSKIKQLSVGNWLWVLLMTFVFPFICLPIAAVATAIWVDIFYSGDLQQILRTKPFDKK